MERSLPNLIETVAELERRGVGFKSLTESIDTTTTGGKLIFTFSGC
jgi:DNA invertase Pin-like site-specific DNA recombinase